MCKRIADAAANLTVQKRALNSAYAKQKLLRQHWHAAKELIAYLQQDITENNGRVANLETKVNLAQSACTVANRT